MHMIINIVDSYGKVQLDLEIGLDTQEFQVNAQDFIPDDVLLTFHLLNPNSL